MLDRLGGCRTRRVRQAAISAWKGKSIKAFSLRAQWPGAKLYRRASYGAPQFCDFVIARRSRSNLTNLAIHSTSLSIRGFVQWSRQSSSSLSLLLFAFLSESPLVYLRKAHDKQACGHCTGLQIPVLDGFCVRTCDDIGYLWQNSITLIGGNIYIVTFHLRLLRSFHSLAMTGKTNYL